MKLWLVMLWTRILLAGADFECGEATSAVAYLKHAPRFIRHGARRRACGAKYNLATARRRYIEAQADYWYWYPDFEYPV